MSKVFDVVKTPLLGRHLIEASAGTGKTYSLIHIVLRLIIEENIPIDRLLLVTFTKAATAELRQRVRNLLIEAHEAFLEAKDEDERYDKTLLKLIAKWHALGIKEEVFKEAIDRMDDASICTIHSFCQKMLDEHRFSSSEGFDFEIGDDADFRNEVIEQFLRKELTQAKDDQLKAVLLSGSPWKAILDAVTAAPADSKIEFFKQQVFVDPKTGKPKDDLSEDEARIEAAVRSILEHFITTVPEDLRRKKREAGIRSFDDLLMDMYSQLTNLLFIQGVQQRYDGVLIDEFQDTDPIQYAIFKRLFLSTDSSARSVFFVGDPKQSIYRFRNADLNTYLAAKDDIGEVYELDVNYRSNPKLLEAFNRFYGTSQKPFLDSGIDYRAINAGATKTPLTIRTADGQSELPVFEVWQKDENTKLNPSASREQQSALIANEIEALLSGSVYKSEDKKLNPGDIAILVHQKKDAHCLIDHLTRKGIRVLFQDDNNIFKTEEAREMLQILQALESPDDVRALKLARSTRLMGESINRIVPEAFSQEGEQNVDDQAALDARELIEEAHDLAEKRGIAAALSRIMLHCKTQNRLLPVQNGERRLANYQQLIEILQEASLALKGISGLTRWLTQQIAHPVDDDSYHLRIDSDANLVNIMTIHKSKGLEFPVVFLLYANELDISGGFRYKKNVFKEVRDGKITLTISFTALYPEVVESITHEDELEVLRLGYVAMTRASQRLVMPLTYYKNRSQLTGFDNAYTRSLIGKASPTNREFETDIKRFASQGKDSGILIRELDDEVQTLNWHEQCVSDRTHKTSSEKLEAARGQSIPTSWFPTSYTALAKGATETTEALTLIEEKEDSSIEEADAPTETVPVTQRDPSELTIMDFERGLESGTFLHALFEKADFSLVKEAFEGSLEAQEKLNHELWRQIQPFKYHLQPYSVEEWLPVFSQLLKDVLCSKIVNRSVFGTQNDLRLAELDRSAKTAEMSFTIAIGEAEDGREPVTARNLSRLLKHFDPVYHIEIENNHTLKGYLTGAIDLTFEFEGRFFVLDWKGTKLADQPEGFSTAKMIQEIERHHYSLQYLIYLVALRRHLKFCGIEDADQKIGGVIYAFIRGIRADDNPPYGVFTAQPPLALIECLDDFFAHGYDERRIRQFAAQKDN